MIAAATLIVVLFLSLIVVRVAAEALVLTGVSRESARFQARSAWTGTGFTTAEAEKVVSHPVRRRIISMLMLWRSAGLVTAASTLMLSFIDVQARASGFLRFAVLVGGLLALWAFARSVIIDRWLSRVISRALKRYSEIDVRDYAGLLHLAGEYAIMELQLKPGSWLADRTLEQLGLPEEGVLVLGVVRKDGSYIGAPRGGTRLKTGDTVLLYGRSPILADLDRRPAQDQAAHHAAVSEQRRVAQEEAAEGG